MRTAATTLASAVEMNAKKNTRATGTNLASEANRTTLYLGSKESINSLAYMSQTSQFTD